MRARAAQLEQSKEERRKQENFDVFFSYEYLLIRKEERARGEREKSYQQRREERKHFSRKESNMQMSDGKVEDSSYLLDCQSVT